MVTSVMIGSLFNLVHSPEYETWLAGDVTALRTNREVLESWETFWRGHACAAGVPVSVYSQVLAEIRETRGIYEQAGELDDVRC